MPLDQILSDKDRSFAAWGGLQICRYAAEPKPEMCPAILAAFADQELVLLERSADLGNAKAQVEFFKQAERFGMTPTTFEEKPAEMQAYAEKVVRHLESAARAGEREALFMLGGLYRQGVLTHPDTVKAYAYDYALFLADAPGYSPIVKEQEGKLRPGEIKVGQELGMKIFNSCCKNKPSGK